PPPAPPEMNSPKIASIVYWLGKYELSEPQAEPPSCTPFGIDADSALIPPSVPAIWSEETPTVTGPCKPREKPNAPGLAIKLVVLNRRPPKPLPPLMTRTIPDHRPEQSQDGLPTPPHW